jgi:hypothetical protein
MKNLMILTLALGLFYAAPSPALAQEQPTQQATPQPTAEELEKEKTEREKNAYRLLDQVIDEAQSLRLTENRVRVQISAADTLWDRNPGRARSLFTMAGEGVAELGRSSQPTNPRRNDAANQDRRAFQLRQDLVLSAARHDAQLAYQLLAATKPPAPATPTTPNDPRINRLPMMSEDNLEQQLLGRIASLDPKLAAQNAEQMMEKGQFPRSLSDVLNQLYKQDPDAAAKLADKTVKKIQSSNILTNNEAVTLAQSLISTGPRVAASTTASTTTGNTQPSANSSSRGPVLDQSLYTELLGAIVDAALKVTPATAQNNQRPATTTTPSGPVVNRGRLAPPVVVAPGQTSSGPTQAQIEQMNARRLFASLPPLLPTIDQFLPGKSTTIRQKMTEMGMNPSQPGSNAVTLSNNMSADDLVRMAPSAPQQVQTRLYQQAAFKALEEGNTDRARQIANDYLPANTRDSVMQRIEMRELAKKTGPTSFEDIRQMVNRLQSDNEKINTLVEAAMTAQQSNPKLTGQLLEEAKQMVNHRATSYEQFEQQLRVARGYATVDPTRSFEILDPGISQLNELLSAAAVLSGFEINMFRDGEMAIQGGNGLTSTITRFGEELATLARSDFERSDALAGRFQFTEPRIMTRLAIVRGLLSTPRPQTPTGPGVTTVRGVGQNFNIARPE